MEPKSKYGSKLFDALSVKVTRTPDYCERCVLSESFRFFDNALLIGIIDEIVGMKIPMKSACSVALPPGAIEGIKPRSSLKSML